MGMTMTQKILAAHAGLDSVEAGQLILVNLDRVLGNDITSPVAIREFNKLNKDNVFDKDKVTMVMDHFAPNKDIKAATQCKMCRDFCGEKEITHFYDVGQMGIEHALLPEKGLVVSGDVVIGADSHTCTYGALGAFSTGVGSTDMACGMAIGKAWFKVPSAIKFVLKGKLNPYISGKDVILHLIGLIGVDGALYQSLDYCGEGVAALSMDDRLCIANMSIEAGARAGMIAPDETTFEYLKGRPHAPEGELWDQAVAYWKTLKTDDDAVFDKVVDIDATKLGPYVTWGTNPGQGLPITASVPEPGKIADATKRAAAERAITYMGLKPGMPIKDIAVDTVFIGSCTNGRIDDLRQAAAIMKGHRKAENIHRVLVVPASSRVRLQAEKEGLDKVFKDFGAEWRNAGCSMCLGMNPDKLVPNERSISTSNRNFEGRQGKGSRTHLASPAVAAATAIRGTISSPADL